MNTSKPILYLVCLTAFLCLFSACEDFVLPEEGTLADLTPPQAGFTFTQNEADYREVSFTNLSLSATDFVWDFGDGTTSNEENPTHVYAKDSTYFVTLTATDKLTVSNSTSDSIPVIEPPNTFEPEILNPGFDIEGSDSFRDNWRNGNLGGVIQITSSPVHEGEKAAKLPSAGDRIGYQNIIVEKNKEYTLSFYYTIKESPAGSITVSVLGGTVDDPGQIAAATIASTTVNDQTDASTFVQGTVDFNAGDNTVVAIYFTNTGAECRMDTFSIQEKN